MGLPRNGSCRLIIYRIKFLRSIVPPKDPLIGVLFIYSWKRVLPICSQKQPGGLDHMG